MVAVVGSRMPSNGGLRHAAVFAQELSKAGALIISGLAKGIDGAAHQAALSLGKNFFTLAVCGTGLDLRRNPGERGVSLCPIFMMKLKDLLR
jgi:DNA processing protein